MKYNNRYISIEKKEEDVVWFDTTWYRRGKLKDQENWDLLTGCAITYVENRQDHSGKAKLQELVAYLNKLDHSAIAQPYGQVVLRLPPAGHPLYEDANRPL